MNKNQMRAVSQALRPLAGMVPSARRKAGCSVLTYHGVSEKSRFNCISPELFERQLEWLRSRYRVIPLPDLVAGLEEGGGSPSGSVAITFDDGYANFAEYALPILEKYGFHATLFVPTGKVGSYNDWDAGSENYVRLPLLGWKDLRGLPERSVEIGSHGISHGRLDRMPDAEAEREVRDSRTRLEQETGRLVQFLAYPHGACPSRWGTGSDNDPTKQYRGICTTRWGRFNTSKTVRSLRRIGIWDSDTFEDFVDKMSGCYDWLVFKEGAGRLLRNSPLLGGAAKVS